MRITVVKTAESGVSGLDEIVRLSFQAVIKRPLLNSYEML